MGISTLSNESQQALARLRENRPRLEARVTDVLRRNIVNMTGVFSSVRHIPTQSHEIVAQFLDAVQGELTPGEMHKQLRAWVQRGLGAEGALDAMEALYAAGVEIAANDALFPALDRYRRGFSLGYERARHAETLTQQDQMQRGLYGTLERQIASEREARAALIRRQNQLETAADLARETGSLRDLNELLATACRHLYERLHLEFVAVYLLDDFRQWAILRAGAGEVGASLLEQGYQFPIQESVPITRALTKDHPIFLRDGLDPGQPNGRSLLPATASCVVVPLNVRGTALGFWSAHSNVSDAFTAQDSTVLKLIGDNLAYAIENANLLMRAQAGVEELELAQRGYVRDTWAGRALSKEVVYAQQQDAFAPANGSAPVTTAAEGKGDGVHGALSVPITLRGQVIGAVDLLDVTQPRTWSEEEKALASSVVEQMALAVENARLFGAAQQRELATARINEMARVLSGELDQTKLFQAVYEYLPRLMPTDALIVWFYDAATNTVTRPVLYERGTQYPPSMSPAALFENLSNVLQTNSPVTRNLTRQEWEQERRNPVKSVESSETAASSLYAPLRVGDHVRGFISVQSYQFDAYGEAQSALLTSVANHVATALENAQLFAETKQALSETQTLYEISARLNAANTVQEALEAAAGSAIVQGAFSASLMRVEADEEGELLELHSAAQWPRHPEPATLLETEIGRIDVMAVRSWIENPHEPTLSEDTTKDPRIHETVKASFLKHGIGATALLPLKIGKRWVGLLQFNWREPRTFTVRDLRLFRSIMAQAVTVLDNRALFDATQQALAQTRSALQQVQEAQDRLNLQYQTANLLARATLFEHVARQLLENTCRSLNWQIGENWTIDERTQRLVLTDVWSADDEALRTFASDSYGLTFQPGEGLAGRAWSEKRPLWIADIANESGFRQAGKALEAGLKSAFAFPLQTENRQYGVTVFFSTRPQALDDSLMATMSGVGNQIGQFLERRRAEEAVRQQNTYLTALHDTTLGLMRRLDVDELLENIITRAGELIGTEHGYVHLIEPMGDELRMRVGIGIYQDFVGTRVKAGQGLAGTVWRDGEPVVVDDYRYWQGRLPMVDRDVLRAVVGVPLKSGTQTVGVLGLASLEEGRRFGAAQIEALERFAELAAVALDNAQLYNSSQKALRQTQRLAEREKASAEIADKLYAAPDVRSVLRTAAEELRRTTGSRRATVRLNLGANLEVRQSSGRQDGNGAPENGSREAVSSTVSKESQ